METIPTTTTLTSEIVAAYVRHHSVNPSQIPEIISSVYESLAGLGQPEKPIEAPRHPAVSVRRSVHPEYVVCIECGWKGKMLRRHLTSAHGMTPADYRTRWSLSPDHPLTAPNYSEQRSSFAKTIGLGRRGAAAAPEATSAAPAAAAPASTGPKRARRAAPKKSAAAQKANGAKKPSRAKASAAKATAAKKPSRAKKAAAPAKAARVRKTTTATKKAAPRSRKPAAAKQPDAPVADAAVNQSVTETPPTENPPLA